MNIFNKEQKEKADFIINHEYSKFSTLHSKEIQDLAILWTYYSGKIEGSTYTYLETDILINEGLTSTSGAATYVDAKMLKNLYNTFISCVREIKNNKSIELTEQKILSLHSSLASELVNYSELGKFRNEQVRISGTDYMPSEDRSSIIAYKCCNYLNDSKRIKNPIEQAVFLHCNIARLQPFIDGNKRISRLVESITLMNNDIIPIYSNKKEDIFKYRDAILCFYEEQDYSKYADYVLNKRIREIENYDKNKEENSKFANEIKKRESKLKGFNMNGKDEDLEL